MHHVIVGAGPAGVTAAEAIRELDAAARITLVGDEPEPPYSRMAIPYMLIGKIGEDGTHLRKAPDHFAALGIEVRRGVRMQALDAAAGTITLADGARLSYDRLLLALGARPARPPIPGLDLPGVHTCWTLADARRIAALATPGSHVVLMGAGFVGTIVLEALALRGVSLTVVEMGDRMVPRMMDEVAGNMLKQWCRSKGVDVRTGTGIRAIARKDAGDDTLAVELSSGEVLPAHLVVISAGVVPNVEAVADSGLKVEGGILVDRHMRTNLDRIFAAGDVAKGHSLSSGLPEVHAIQPTAVEHARIAALNMTGRTAAYQGSLIMNTLDTMGLISCSFGAWAGVPGGCSARMVDAAGWRYIRLEFHDNRLVGATTVGHLAHIGALRGLIQTGMALGPWEARLASDPSRAAEALVALNHGLAG